MRTWKALLCAAALLSGCGNEDPSPVAPGKTPADTTGNGGVVKKAGTLPMTVSAGFAPSGYMGDGGSTPGAVAMTTTDCLAPRSAGAVGDCYKVTYKPGGAGWAGVYWQYPGNNWGGSQGFKVDAGATKVTFWAAGETDGIDLEISAGGINPYGAEGAFSDAFTAKKNIKLGTAWAKYTLDLGAPTYTSVLGGFCWAMPALAGGAPAVFWLDGIQWEK